MGLLTQSAYAKRRGVSQPYISNLVKKKIVKTVAGKIDPDDADRRIEAASHPGRSHHKDKNGGSENHPNYYDALTEHTEFKAKLAKLLYEEKCGRLVSVDKIQKEAARIGKAVRDRILAVPKRIDGLLAAETDQFRINNLLTDELTLALEGLNGLNGSGSRTRTRARRKKARPT